MYYYIKGIFIQKYENFIVVEAGGIGYRIYTPASVLDNLPPQGKEVRLFTHFHVREDTQDLYGFLTEEEKNLFLQLLSVSGVGPKVALAILSVNTTASFAMAVITNDVKTITKAPGVGPKVAQRIILELRDKMKTVDAAPDQETAQVLLQNENERSEAVSALIVLGYPASEAKKTVASLPQDLGTEDLIREALKKLMK
ncbi:MAG: Holliday junction branch migration protein RuvA [Ruminococcaceae bacterium]|nr:Holliday junction branch migration protein RuvA [Oscillospiraceae bacterium]